MLFSYNKFWKTLTIVLFSWALYVIWGYQFTIITLLALILAKNN